MSNKDKKKEKITKEDTNDNLKIIISGLVGFLLIGFLFFPFIHNGYFCTDSLSSKIVGNILLYLTILPLSFIGIGLMFYIHPLIVAVFYFIYYSLICWKWCHSRWMFVIILLLYLPYFYLLIKVKSIYRILLGLTNDLNIDDIVGEIGKLNKVKKNKKNNNNNK